MALYGSEFLLMVLILVNVVHGDDINKEVVAARVESCKGCQLNRLPETKKFIFEDVPLFDNVEFKHIQGAPPELVLLNKDYKVVERIDLAPLSRQDCNDLLVKRGFHRKDEASPKTPHKDL